MAQVVDLNEIGACVVKSTSREPRLGNPTPRIVETPAGILNAIGLQNGGVENFIEEKLPFLRQFDVPIIVNLVGYEVGGLCLSRRAADGGGRGAWAGDQHLLPQRQARLRLRRGPPARRANSSPPSAASTDLTLITKLSPNVTDIRPIAGAAIEAGSDALSLINTLLGTSIDIRKRKFRLANITGGLSGPAVKPVALRLVWQVHQAFPKSP